MFTVHQHFLAASNLLVDPARALLELINRQRVRIGRRQVEQIDSFTCQRLGIILVFGAGIYHAGDALPTQSGNVSWEDAATDGEMRGNPTHVELVGQGYADARGEGG